ncbi:MAG: tRNA pseudouridine(38-40) synthase TruA, partial [Chlamydiales bacterium]|nr:tRNA pseudouridine(38-40) synthase TruA [Chlamydiales bacterium]
MPTYKLTLSYDGRAYGGWQIQSNAVSIQALVEKALTTALRSPTALHGSSRTDSGVHALAQIAHFIHPIPIDTYRILHSLNGLLPKDIRILSLEESPSDFHARYDAKRKIYHYHLYLDPISDPFLEPYRYQVPHPIDIDLLQKAASFFIGTHDFTSFSHEASQGAASRNPIRTIYRLDLVPEPKGIRLEFEGDGFLYKMVRNIVGTLLDISHHKIPLKALPDIFAAKDRTKAGRTAPPHALFLVKVYYNTTSAREEKCKASSLEHS